MFQSTFLCKILVRKFNKAVNYFPKYLMNRFPKTDCSKLKNGLTVTSENWNCVTCTVGLWMDIGSRCENDQNNGVAHFLEHMYFKGTVNRDHLKIENEALKRGVILKSYLTREMIAIYANCHKDDVEWAVSLLSEIITQPKYDEGIVEKEKQVILNEMQNIEKNYREVVFDYLHATAYQGTPLGQSILGLKDNVLKMTAKTLLDFINNFYKAPRITLVAAGDIKHETLVNLADKHLGNVSCNYENGIDEKLPCRFTSSDIRDRDDALPIGHVAIAFRGPGAGHIDNIALWIATALNGSYDKTYGGTIFTASRMAAQSFKDANIRSYHNFFLPYYDTSLWGFYYTCTGMEMRMISEYILSQVVRLCTNITEFEVTRAKNQLKTHMIANLNGTENICNEIGHHMNIYGRRIGVEEMISRMDTVDADMVRDTCMKYVYDKSPAMAAYGPIEGLPDLNVTASKTWWLRY